MPSLHVVPVAVRRLLARRPWIYWLVVLVIALVAAATVRQRVAGIDEARRGWGETRSVLVALGDARPGQSIAVEVRDVPAAIVPPAALPGDSAGDALIARQGVSTGEIVTAADVGRSGYEGAAALLPDGWAAVPVVESPPLGAAIGDRVRVVSDGIVLAPDAIVVDYHDDVTLIAVPVDVAPTVAAGAESGGLAVLLLP
jgi:hypothetical protein